MFTDSHEGKQRNELAARSTGSIGFLINCVNLRSDFIVGNRFFFSCKGSSESDPSNVSTLEFNCYSESRNYVRSSLFVFSEFIIVGIGGVINVENLNVWLD